MMVVAIGTVTGALGMLCGLAGRSLPRAGRLKPAHQIVAQNPRN
jgi:hypothetical protein